MQYFQSCDPCKGTSFCEDQVLNGGIHTVNVLSIRDENGKENQYGGGFG